jgi:hypothetical protein
MTFLTNKKILITLGVGIVSVVCLAAIGIKSVTKQVENIFNLLDGDFIDFDEDDIEDGLDFEEDSDNPTEKNYLSLFKR